MTRWLFDTLPWFEEQLGACQLAAVMLDFDGTLAPIVPDPDAAHMPPATRELLAALASSQRSEVAVISGRSIHDLEQRVGLDQVYYAGNHGLEMRHGDWRFLAPGAAETSALLERLAGEIEAKVSSIAGSLVENKGLTLSVHSRRVARADLPELTRRVVSVLDSSQDLLNLRRGREVFEISPRIGWNKGNAAAWILEQMGKDAALPIYIGDDITDEDAFVALHQGVTVRVGESERSAARFHVSDTEEVRESLEWIHSRLQRWEKADGQ